MGFERAVQRDWDLPGLARDLSAETFEIVEPGRKERRIVLHNYDQILFLAKEAVSSSTWRDVVAEGAEHEFTDYYIAAVAEAVTPLMGADVYAFWDDNRAYLGQYMQYEAPQAPGVLDWNPEESL